MTIRCQCKGCSARFDAPDALAGKAVRCPKCKAAIRLPGAKHENVAASTPAGGSTQEPSWFVRDTEGRHHGPLPKTELDRLVEAGRLDGLCQLRRADWEDWRWIETVYQQFAEKEAGDAPAETDASVVNEQTAVAGPRLAECPDCGKIVSRRATQCPNCGCPIALVNASTVGRASRNDQPRDVSGRFRSSEDETNEFHPKHRGGLGKAVLLTALVSALVILMAGSTYLGWKLWQRSQKPPEIQIVPFTPPQPPPAVEPAAPEPATPEQIAAWIEEVASQTARRLDAEYQRMHLARTGIQAMQEQAELIDSLVTGEFAKSAKHDKPKRPPPPPYQSQYEPLRKECTEYLKKNTNPKSATRATIVDQANRWAETKRSPMQKALEGQLNAPLQ